MLTYFHHHCQPLECPQGVALAAAVDRRCSAAPFSLPAILEALGTMPKIYLFSKNISEFFQRTSLNEQ